MTSSPPIKRFVSFFTNWDMHKTGYIHFTEILGVYRYHPKLIRAKDALKLLLAYIGKKAFFCLRLGWNEHTTPQRNVVDAEACSFP